INNSKTRMQYRGSRQLVTGLVVNKKVNVRDAYKKYARAMSNSLFKTGEYHIPGSAQPNQISSLRKLEGVLNHIFSVEEFSDRRTHAEAAKEPTAFRQLYRDFLFFKYFVSLPKPIIVCEGKTDSIHLRAAM